jgi:hypothetical protein
VTLPRPDLPVVLLSHRGPVSFERDESGRRTGRRGDGGWRPGGPQHQPQPPRRVDRARPTEAVADFLRSDMGALFLGSLLVEKPAPA